MRNTLKNSHLKWLNSCHIQLFTATTIERHKEVFIYFCHENAIDLRTFSFNKGTCHWVGSEPRLSDEVALCHILYVFSQNYKVDVCYTLGKHTTFKPLKNVNFIWNFFWSLRGKYFQSNCSDIWASVISKSHLNSNI